MRPRAAAVRAARIALIVVTLLSLVWLCVTAARPQAALWLPAPLAEFGRPVSAVTIAVAVSAIVALCVVSFRSHNSRRTGNVPVVVIAGLAATSVVLGLSSFWHCHDGSHPVVFQPLLWTVSLVKGGVSDFSLGPNHICPNPVPDALWVARLTALGAIFTGLAGVVIALFRSQVDRLRVNLASSVTAVVGVDDETRPMIGAIAATPRSGTLVVVTSGPDDPGAQEARLHGGRVLSVDLDDSNALASLSLWRKLDRLYLMSPDPPTNQLRLDAITRALSTVGHRQRIPLTVRVDDPWQAEAWRAEQLGGTDTRWAADAVGKYEVTARWLLDTIVGLGTIDRVFICGASELTLALCADMTRRKLEDDYFSEPGGNALPTVSLVGADADEYLRDHEFHRRQVGFASTGPAIDATSQQPTVSVLMRLIGDGGGSSSAVIFVDDPTAGASNARSVGTRLAARYPTMPIYVWDVVTRMTADPLSIVGRLRTYRLALDAPGGRSHDVWERAAKLIHQQYALGDPKPDPSPATRPWADLDPFYQVSNRRLVANALWMVERIAEHTWNTLGDPPTPLTAEQMEVLTPLQKLERMGFDDDAAMRMAKAEHEDWCRYYRDHKWKYDPVRDDARRRHDKLVDWHVVQDNPVLLNAALKNLAATLWSLRQLGYRSRSVWRQFDRIDRDESAMRATVSARPARAGETIDTLEGPIVAGDGDWVVRSENGEQRPVPALEFSECYTAQQPQPSGPR